MSLLRKHLQAEKDRHQAFVYPGNLAQEILGAGKAKKASVMDYADASLGQRSSLIRWLLGFGSLVAAAVIALVIYTHHVPAPTATNQQEAVANNNDDEQVPIAPNMTASLPDGQDLSIVPGDVGNLVPEYQSVTFPTVPSFSDTTNTDDDTTQTSQESA